MRAPQLILPRETFACEKGHIVKASTPHSVLVMTDGDGVSAPQMIGLPVCFQCLSEMLGPIKSLQLTDEEAAEMEAAASNQLKRDVFRRAELRIKEQFRRGDGNDEEQKDGNA